MKFDRTKMLLGGILIVAFLLRIYRVYDLTEFLGDQGRESIVLYNAWHTGTLPLIGPPVSTGQHLGPVYYYLIAPFFFLAGFSPMGPIILMIILDTVTVLLLFRFNTKLFSRNTALIMSFLYATSPLIVQASRTVWNPTPIPFFTTLLAIGLYDFVKNRKFNRLPLSLALLGVLVQLHYSTLILIPLTVTLVVYAWVQYRKDRVELINNSILGIVLFFVLILPFLLHESQNDWQNIRSLAIFASSQSTTPLRTDLKDTMFVTQHLVNFIVPSLQPIASVGVLLLLGIVALAQKNKWAISALLVTVVSIAFIAKSVYSPPEHYARFLMPFLFILAALSMHTLGKINTFIPILATGILVMFAYVPRLDVLGEGKHDLSRTEDMVETIIQDADSEPFSFTLISSRSFSDLHYRFFFLRKSTEPVSVETGEFHKLYLICEKEPCPTVEELLSRSELQVMCFDPLCTREYPKIDMSQWQFASMMKRERGTLYIFTRHPGEMSKQVR
ncbi:glycosyltransferase family 39 protein, partial [Candidatus Roizmanbacteria bacterium]|nr:glycosyltransferase family 39 protein [Candidatus Roizmanbacteria bacterium]